MFYYIHESKMKRWRKWVQKWIDGDEPLWRKRKKKKSPLRIKCNGVPHIRHEFTNRGNGELERHIIIRRVTVTNQLQYVID
jgi:endonuclease YncB( thermonuclease family)